MEHINLIETFKEFKELNNIDKTTIVRILEDAFRSQLVKQYGSDEKFNVIVNPDKGDLEVWKNRIVVADDEIVDENLQISLTDARKIDADFEIGEEVTEEVNYLKEFGRRAILNLRQNLAGAITELQRDGIYQMYKDRIGQIIVGEVYQVWKREVLIRDDEGIDLILPKSEQIPSDFFRKGDTVKAVVIRVDIKNNNPYIIISRTSPIFLERLFEVEVPEIFDGLITIKKIVRMSL
jgi:N utilization substance protein A